MQNDYQQMDLMSIRNLFLEEMRLYLAALDIESPEQLRIRKERIKEIDGFLEAKKKLSNSKNLDLV